jgi:hypothetical protein
LRDSIALVVQMIVRISTSWSRNGMNSLQALRHSLTAAGYLAAHRSANSSMRVCLLGVDGGGDRLEVTAI